ncbi:hypothetical protein JRO89_XS04G0132200 [Xanthoceras sorbifolium]|uniref:Retrovirus-related Pol polyprotein from transposon TNT 1-94-like beta-barrel domain-containing protein n=1 Tax=Xanthoceras sorbifolium TaxID=99658 RepID=A0ABQ8I5P3_9ROSI|nr:hypothetical protein JRO89_XS04G0132200 [Xanthoceras sorbifolium]
MGRQDQLILNALIGSLSPILISFIARATTSREAWTVLTNTYAKLTHARADELAILGAPMEEEGVTEKILDGLGDDYKELVMQVSAQIITTSAAHLWSLIQVLQLATIALHPDHIRDFVKSVTLKVTQSSVVRSFQLVPIQPSTTSNNSATHWQPRAHYAVNTTTNNPSWLLDSGASHHVTTDLSNLSLHAPYIGSDDVIMDDGTDLSISHTGSASIPTSTTTFTLNDVLCVPTMKKKT